MIGTATGFGVAIIVLTTGVNHGHDSTRSPPFTTPTGTIPTTAINCSVTAIGTLITYVTCKHHGLAVLGAAGRVTPSLRTPPMTGNTLGIGVGTNSTPGTDRKTGLVTTTVAAAHTHPVKNAHLKAEKTTISRTASTTAVPHVMSAGAGGLDF